VGGGSLREREVSSASSNLRIEDVQPGGFLNGFYDDESWWALAWLKVYDLVGNEEYRTAAEVIFQDLRTTATNATCGGVWWDRAQTANTAIANALYIAVAAKLAETVPKRRGFYLNYALANWAWFESSGLINDQNQVNDGIDLQTCQNNGGEVWSYNQGVILGALVSLATLTSNVTYLNVATSIADAAITHMTDVNGVLHDPHEPDLGADGPTFKGVFVRNLKTLYDMVKKPSYKSFLEANAQSVWVNARNASTGVITNVWSGPLDQRFAGPAGHAAGLEALIAAAGVQ
jgi:predicted alpha-1,6-mannanase (GH76 family)